MTKIKKKRLIGRLLHVRRDKDRLDIAKDGLDAIIRCFMASVLLACFASNQFLTRLIQLKCSIRTEVATSSIPKIAATVENMVSTFSFSLILATLTRI